MLDTEEQQRIREQYATDPGAGHLVEQYASERENALALGQPDRAEHAEARMEALGYATPEKRAQAAEQRKAAAEVQAATDENAAEKAEPAKPADARRQAPAERKSPQDRQASTIQPGKRQET